MHTMGVFDEFMIFTKACRPPLSPAPSPSISSTRTRVVEGGGLDEAVGVKKLIELVEVASPRIVSIDFLFREEEALISIK
jgi:hypothetical protein